MKKSLSTLLLTAGLSALIGNLSPVHATSYIGNGNSGFNGAVGNGILNVTNNGSGGFNFAFTLGGNATNLSGNDIVIYIDNGKGGGIGTSTANLTDTTDSGREAISAFDGTTNRSTLNFGGLMNPQYALDLSASNGNSFGLVNNGTFNYQGGSPAGGTANNGGVYTVTTTGGNTTFSLNLPATLVGLNSFSGAALKFFAIQTSETGYTSNEATAPIAFTGGTQGYGTTGTISNVNRFTAAVPEPGTWAMLAVWGLGGLVLIRRRASVRA